MTKINIAPHVTRGADLTDQMLADFKPFVKDFAAFEKIVRECERDMGSPVIIIESYPFPDGRPGIMEKRYYFDEDTSCPDWEINAITSGVDSL